MTAVTGGQGANRLHTETSPYLLQHAHNPVDWYPWGPEALARAAAEDKPILLSIGYSACHWCHVMAHESFEDPETARLMNELFVNIKVDREERPDLDAIYMEAVQAMTGRGGWPMTVFLTPDGKPFYGGTYYPPEPRYGMPSFRQLLRAIAEAWQGRRPELDAAGLRMAEALQRSVTLQPSDIPLVSDLLDRAAQNAVRSYDRTEGGFGGAPKFPQPMTLDFLLLSHRRTGQAEQLAAVQNTLQKMAHGGIYDQLGGGFHRYATDAHWLVPHFEKMLYDNAQLARTYLHAWQVTGDREFRRITEETLDYVLQEMLAPEGGFYSAQDADSEGEEGKFFLWTPDEVRALLGEEDARLFSAYYDVTAAGNFHEGGPGASILHVIQDMAAVARAQGVSSERLADVLAHSREVLFAARAQRVKPGRDEKILAEWNGLMMHAFAEAGAALGRADYLAAAEQTARFILEQMMVKGEDGLLRLQRMHSRSGDGAAAARAYGYLEDYAAMGLGLLGLYSATLDAVWLLRSLELAHSVEVLFGDTGSVAFFQTSREHEQLVARRKDLVDNAVPSGNSLAAELFLRLGKLTENAAFTRHAEGIMHAVANAMGEQPLAFGRMLCALDFYLTPGQEIAVVGDPADAGTRALLAEVWSRFLPNSVLALLPPDDLDLISVLPFLEGRTQRDGKPAAYVCRNYTCNLPVVEPHELAKQLA